MTKPDVISKMAELADGTKVDAEKWLDAFLGTINYAVDSREQMKINGYFTLEVKDTNERNGRNPATGESLVIPASQTVKIKVSKTLKARVK